MEIVFINGDDKERGLYRIYLENILDDCTVHEFFSYRAAIDFLNNTKKSEPAFFLVSDNAEGIIGDIYTFCHENFSKKPFVLFSQMPPDMIEGLESFLSHHPQNGNISLPISPADFRERILGVVYPDRMNLQPVPAFQKVRLFNFYRFNKTHCHVYLKLSRMKYVKVLNQNIKYSRIELDKLKAKSIDYLYIRNEDFQRFQVSFFRNSFLEFDTNLASPAELNEKLEFTHAMLHELVLNLGFSKDAIELTEKSLQAIFGIVEKDIRLGDLLNSFKGRDDYLYDHSYLTSVICCDILKRMGIWSDERMETLTYASLFHDITLKSPELAKITKKNDDALNKFSQEEVKRYLRHPLDAFELVLENPRIPKKVADIICQHHETPEGDGFPNKLRPVNIDRLSCIFIMAHDFVNALDEFDYDEAKIGSILDYMQGRYHVGPFKEVLKAFLEQYEKAA